MYYLWWLNGNQLSFTTKPVAIQRKLNPNCTSRYVYGIRKMIKKHHLLAKKMVVIRMGDVANTDNPTFALSDFDSVLWQKISALYQ
jgi:hypothetical protein